MFGEWKKVVDGTVVRSEIDRPAFFEFMSIKGELLEAGTGRTLADGKPEFLVRFSKTFASNADAQAWVRKMWNCEIEAGRKAKPFVDALVDTLSTKPEVGQTFYIVMATGPVAALKLQGNNMMQLIDTKKRIPVPANMRKAAPYTYVIERAPQAQIKAIAKAMR